KTGLKDSESKIPANRQSIHTGKFAPATLITGLHPEMKNIGQERTKWLNRKLVISVSSRSIPLRVQCTRTERKLCFSENSDNKITSLPFCQVSRRELMWRRIRRRLCAYGVDQRGRRNQ